jgi:hypothetical protein
MAACTTRKTFTFAALLALLLFAVALLPAVARAAWVSTDAHIVDPYGTGYVNLLNVQVDAVASNDTTAVVGVQFSDDGQHWYEAPYDGLPQPWVLAGGSGAKTLYVRFAGQDGSLSPAVQTGIVVDTAAPHTRSLGSVRCARGGRATFSFTATDAVSPRVRAQIQVLHGGRSVAAYELGWIAVGSHQVTLPVKLANGVYTWRVRAMDLAHWAGEGASPSTLTVR